MMCRSLFLLLIAGSSLAKISPNSEDTCDGISHNFDLTLTSEQDLRMQLEEKLTSLLMNNFDGDLVINTQIFENVARTNLNHTTTDRDDTTDNNVEYSSSASSNDVTTDPFYSRTNLITEKTELSTKKEITTALTKYTDWEWPRSTDKLITTDKDDIGDVVTTDTDSTLLQSSTLTTLVNRNEGSSHSDLPEDCTNMHKKNAKTKNATGGVFDIYPELNESSIEVYCDLVTDGGGWIVFQRRMDGSENFYRNYSDYVKGFGKADREMWLGLETLNLITNKYDCELRIDMKDWENNTSYAKYGVFKVGDETNKYHLTVGEYSGNAGDSMRNHSTMNFTTKDYDNDIWQRNCAQRFRGGWWYNKCHQSNPNGIYLSGESEFGVGISWFTWKTHRYSLKFIEIKLRKKSETI
uniref:techylectin-5B-like n=1 Tax=Styela clava TaxID=7725 RepID=UPI001939EAA8|nr:techylectin-5B-like [Styela clava]